MDNAYTNVYVRETALFSHHLTEGLKPAHGDYPQVQLKPELHQQNQNIHETVRDFIDGEDDPSIDTRLGRMLRQVHVQIFAKLEAHEGKYDDFYNAFSRPLRDWVADSYTGEEEQRRRSEGFMSKFIASLGDK